MQTGKYTVYQTIALLYKHTFLIISHQLLVGSINPYSPLGTSDNYSMFLIYFLLALARVSQVVSLDGLQRPIPNNLIESNSLRQLLDERQEKFNIDPSLLQGKSQYGKDEKSSISDIAVGLLIHELAKTSNFPTLVATNISEKCHNDSQAYFDANLLLVNWANQSIY